MTRFFAALFALWTAMIPAQAQDARAIEDVISDQLNAFTARDVDTAWTYASPMIQGMFGNPQNFGMMVERGYPMVWNNSDVRFLELRDVNGAPTQKIMLRDTRGGLHILDYSMIETEDGWQINGVQLLEPPDVGT